MKIDIAALKLCLVTQMGERSFDEYSAFLLEAIKGGVTSVQLRDKSLSDEKFSDLARQLKVFLDAVGDIPLIINDRVKVAAAIDAAGAHVGQDDISPQEARAILGEDKFLGLSIESLEQLQTANEKYHGIIDYVAASAIFPSRTKVDCQYFWGLEGLEQFVEHSDYDVVTIGGINPENAAAVMSRGPCGIAAIGALHTQDSRTGAEIMIREMDKGIEAFNAKRCTTCFRL